MIDREKVIKGLECCAGQCNYHGCPYKDPCENANGVKQIMLDALALLKEKNGCENCAIAIEDRQPVVRCKDCRYWTSEKILEYHICKRWEKTGVKNFATAGDWFCADGIAKDINVPDKEGR